MSAIELEAQLYNVQQQQLQNDNENNDDNDNLWFNKFITDGSPLESSETVATNSTTTTATSPLEFSSLFDHDSLSTCNNINSSSGNGARSNLVFDSADTSLENSPQIKPEFTLNPIPPIQLSSSTTSLSSSFSNASSNESAGTTGTAGSTATKQKKKRAPRKRLTPHQKQAHNKIEKRYRININAKIAGLQKIIPWVSSEKTAFEIGDGSKPLNDDVPKLNKSIILEKAMDYILFLQKSQSDLKQENEALRQRLNLSAGEPSLASAI